MAYNGSAAANFADSHAEPHSTGNCAKYVRHAVEWGGISVEPTGSAKDYGGRLESAGFYEIYGDPRKGDVVVIQPIPGHPHGHMALFDGLIWVSDFRQQAGADGFYPGSAYKSIKPPYKIYRHD